MIACTLFGDLLIWGGLSFQVELGATSRHALQEKLTSVLFVDPEAFIERGVGLTTLTGGRLAEIFFSAKFSLPRDQSRALSCVLR